MGPEWCRVGPLLLTSRASFVDANLGGVCRRAPCCCCSFCAAAGAVGNFVVDFLAYHHNNLYSSHTSRTRPSGAEWGGVVPSRATFVDK